MKQVFLLLQFFFSPIPLKIDCFVNSLQFIQGANLIGIDSLGIDVRVYCGMEARTLRFPFSARVSIVMQGTSSISFTSTLG